MSPDKKQNIKARLHVRNLNREPYDLEALIQVVPDLKNFMQVNKHGSNSVDFANPAAVKLLNTALLKHYYKIDFWEFPDQNLCPPIPGRADYIHYLADLLRENNFGKIPQGDKITCLDIGTGASCIYPVLGVKAYDWNFIATDIDPDSVEAAKKIVAQNPALQHKVDCRIQTNPKHIFKGILAPTDKVDLSLCNPPFHASAEEARKGTQRKTRNLSGKANPKTIRNFAGISNELICPGGEIQFIQNMVEESTRYAQNCFWFTSLVSKQSSLKAIMQKLGDVKAAQIKTIPMGTGNKSTRMVAWSFFSKAERIAWAKSRWA